MIRRHYLLRKKVDSMAALEQTTPAHLHFPHSLFPSHHTTRLLAPLLA
jgi:hypothetical protein